LFIKATISSLISIFFGSVQMTTLTFTVLNPAINVP